MDILYIRVCTATVAMVTTLVLQYVCGKFQIPHKVHCKKGVTLKTMRQVALV
jgi:hypothetical protein